MVQPEVVVHLSTCSPPGNSWNGQHAVIAGSCLVLVVVLVAVLVPVMIRMKHSSHNNISGRDQPLRKYRSNVTVPGAFLRIGPSGQVSGPRWGNCILPACENCP